jgi:hypothetical protein
MTHLLGLTISSPFVAAVILLALPQRAKLLIRLVVDTGMGPGNGRRVLEHASATQVGIRSLSPEEAAARFVSRVRHPGHLDRGARPGGPVAGRLDHDPRIRLPVTTDPATATERWDSLSEEERAKVRASMGRRCGGRQRAEAPAQPTP